MEDNKMTLNKKAFFDENGKEIKLNSYEEKAADAFAGQLAEAVTRMNAVTASPVGVAIDINTLTLVLKTISKQKFYQIDLDRYLKTDIYGGWADQVLQVREFLPSKPMAGFTDQSAHGAKIAVAEAAVDGIYIPVITWLEQIEVSLAELNQAAMLGNWSILEAKERSRKKAHDLDMQQLFFTGFKKLNGLLTFADVATVDTNLLKSKISDLSYDDLNNFAKALVEAYRKNSERTAYPNKLVIPESDFNGLAAQANPQFPLRTKLSMLKEAIDSICPRPVDILPCAYSDSNYNNLGTNRYALYNDDFDTIRFQKAIDYTPTMMNNIDGWNFVNTAFARTSGVVLNRPKELMYFDVANA